MRPSSVCFAERAWRAGLSSLKKSQKSLEEKGFGFLAFRSKITRIREGLASYGVTKKLRSGFDLDLGRTIYGGYQMLESKRIYTCEIFRKGYIYADLKS